MQPITNISELAALERERMSQPVPLYKLERARRRLARAIEQRDKARKQYETLRKQVESYYFNAVSRNYRLRNESLQHALDNAMRKLGEREANKP